MECVGGSATGEEAYKGTIFSCKDLGFLGTCCRPDGRPWLDRFSAVGIRFRVGSSRIRRHAVGAAHAGFGLVVRTFHDHRSSREGDLRWVTLKRRLRLNTPRDPTTGEPRARLWLWVVPFLVAVAVVELVLNSPMENAWVSVFPFFAEPQGY